MVIVPAVIFAPIEIDPAVCTFPIVITLPPEPPAMIVFWPAEVEPSVIAPVPAAAPIKIVPVVWGVKVMADPDPP
jgi:hypothetical protein